VTTGKSQYIDSFDIIRPTPAPKAHIAPTREPRTLSVELLLETADDLHTDKPELEVARISPTPLT